MAFLDDLGKKISNAAQTTVQKSKDLADSAKNSMAISAEEKEINRLYQELGAWYYNCLLYTSERSPEGKWRWIAYDFDWAFFHSSPGTLNGLARITNEKGMGATGGISTMILRRLLQNSTFKELFLERYAYLSLIHISFWILPIQSTWRYAFCNNPMHRWIYNVVTIVFLWTNIRTPTTCRRPF